MVDIGGKEITVRSATATGFVLLQPEHLEALANNPKGDPMQVAQVAGIQAAKKCADLIPLCHNIPLSKVDIDINLYRFKIEIVATVESTGATGVEMEAYCALVGAGLTVIDMLKGASPNLVLSEVRLIKKSGGKQDYKYVEEINK